MKKSVLRSKAAAGILCAAVALCGSGCGKAEGNSGGESAMGRYVEEAVSYDGGKDTFVSLIQEEETMRLLDLYGSDVISRDGGVSFEEDAAVTAAGGGGEPGRILSMAGTVDGSRICMEYQGGSKTWRLITADGGEIELEGLGHQDYPSFYQGGGCFYMSKGFEIYQIDPESGETRFLTESTSYPLYLASDGEMLFVIHGNGVLLFDLQKNQVAARQDEVLSSFFSGKQEAFLNGETTILLYPLGEDIYVLTHDGIFLHKLYGESMEPIVDGGSCAIGDIRRGFAGMAVTGGSRDEIGESENTGEENAGSDKVFTILYTDGGLMRYAKDDSLPAQPEISLRVYSLYEDGNIRQAVSAFRQKYPELYIRYEVGVDPDHGATKEDALGNLSTELAAGTGPDILVVDDIPFETYVEKGVLADLGFLREEMSEETYFTNVTDGFATEQGLYVIPLTFAVPVLAGNAGTLEGAGELENLSQLADLLESASGGQAGTAGGQEGSVIGFLSAEEALRLFAQSSMGTWRTQEGALDREAVTEFLTQVKRIYDIQMKNLPEEIQNMFFSGTEWGSGENTLARRNGSYGLAEALDICIMRFGEQPFCAGFLTSATEDFPMTVGKLHYMDQEGEYVPLPGQCFGGCLPATLMAMNSGTEHGEESRLFLEYLFSQEFQGAVSLNGTPVNRSVYRQRQQNPKEGSAAPYATMGYALSDGSTVMHQVYWPSGADFARLDSLMESVKGVNYCDDRIYEAVMTLGQAALTGDAGIEETVDGIEKELELYLAE